MLILQKRKESLNLQNMNSTRIALGTWSWGSGAEVLRLEVLAENTGIDTRGSWEHTME